MTKVNNMYNSFKFVGEAVFNADNYYTSTTSASGYSYSRINFGIKTEQGNIVYCELMGGKNKVINTSDKEGNKLEIDFADRLDQTIIDTVADYRKLRMNFANAEYKDSKQFITEFDAVEHIKENLMKGQRLVVQGNIKINRYRNQRDGKMVQNMKYEPKTIRLATEEDKNVAELKMHFAFDKDSIETDRFESEKKIDVSALLTTWSKEAQNNVFIPFPVVLDLNYCRAKLLKPMADDMFPAFTNMMVNYLKVKSGKIMEAEWIAHLINGQQTVGSEEMELSEEQKLQIEWGIVTEEQVRKEQSRGMVGDRITEIRLIRPTMRLKNDDGDLVVSKETDYTPDDLLIPEIGIESKDAVFGGTKTETPKDTANVLNSLFG